MNEQLSLPETALKRSHALRVTPPLSTWEIVASRHLALLELERRLQPVLATYSNVHRGSGYASKVTTALYEHARIVALEYLSLEHTDYVVIFSSPRNAAQLMLELSPRLNKVHLPLKSVSSETLGLPLGVRAIAVPRKVLPTGAPVRSGGGTARYLTMRTAVWEGAPDRFEPGTPAVINVIAFAIALGIVRRCGVNPFCASGDISCIEKTPDDDRFAALHGMELMLALRRTLADGSPMTPACDGSRHYVHFDYAASSPVFSPVWESVRRSWRLTTDERLGLIEETRHACAAFLGAPRDEYAVLFTGNTTEAIQAVATSLAASASANVRPVVVNTWLEHNSNELPWRAVAGVSHLRLSVDDEGFFDIGALEQLLRRYNVEQAEGEQRIVLVSVSGASNVLGTYNDLAEVVRVAHRYGARVLVDAAQLVAHRRIDMVQTGIDYLAFSGHKLYAPFGSGVLIARHDCLGPTRELFEELDKSGQENIGGIAAIDTAIELLTRIGWDVVESEERRLTGRVLGGLKQIPNTKIWGIKETDSAKALQRAGIVSFSLMHVPHSCVAQELADREGIGVRSGCHCAHLLVKRLFGVPKFLDGLGGVILGLFPGLVNRPLPGVVRISLGLGNDDEQVSSLLRALNAIAEAPRKKSERSAAASHGGAVCARSESVTARERAAIDSTIREVFLGNSSSSNS